MDTDTAIAPGYDTDRVEAANVTTSMIIFRLSTNE
jgi:hypothetical protein